MRKSLNLGSPIISTPPQHWHPAIWEHACMVSDAFPSLVSRIVAIPRVLSRFHHLTDTLLLPPSTPSFPPPPHKRDDDRKHCVRHMSVLACGSTTILPSPIAKVVCVPFVAFQSASRTKWRGQLAVKPYKWMARYHLITHAHFHSRESADLKD